MLNFQFYHYIFYLNNIDSKYAAKAVPWTPWGSLQGNKERVGKSPKGGMGWEGMGGQRMEGFGICGSRLTGFV